MHEIPGGEWLIEWGAGIVAMSNGQRVLALGKLFFQLVGMWEFGKHIYRWIFKRRSRLEDEVETLEYRVKERNDTINELRSELKQLADDLTSARNKLPAAAIARAERELRDFNQDLAIDHLEQWFGDNAESVASIAKRLAKYHIARAVPDPTDHLRRAREMLQVARGVAPRDEEVHELSGEFDMVNAALQEQIIRDGDRQFGWNSAMARGLSGEGEALLPIITTLRDIAQWCFDKGLWRLTPIFADRASDLALQGGRPIRRVWCQVESTAAFYQLMVGHLAEALDRVDRVLTQAREFLPPRNTAILDAQVVRAQALSNLGRYGEALAEIDAFAPGPG